ncbi:MAG: hypothetical protein COT73_05710 [Bdellovibrio sp. CG10_big_fil_rev_8_21_14_0_10_47_8]|nr:MAG: hypothetical protein COT73_05710 [Bdellovibrio sp. CG10_big_fil_rev_8_21_14_0_10_47_8]
MKAAIAGLIGAAAMTAAPAHAADDATVKGHCVGANACKGKGGCKQVNKNDCAGKNGCKGKGFVEMTKAECDAKAAKNKKIHFETAGM